MPDCPGDTDGAYPDETDCSMFIICPYMSQGYNAAFPMPCPPGLYFNPTIRECDWPVNVPSCNNQRSKQIGKSKKKLSFSPTNCFLHKLTILFKLADDCSI